MHRVNGGETVPGVVEEDAETCFWLPQEQGGEHCVGSPQLTAESEPNRSET